VRVVAQAAVEGLHDARAATARVARLRRRCGRAEPRSRLRTPTSTVGWKVSGATASPAAADQRRSNAKRSIASRSLKPSCDCSSITVAITRAAVH